MTKPMLPQREPSKKLVELHWHVPAEHSNPTVSSQRLTGHPEAPNDNFGTFF